MHEPEHGGPALGAAPWDENADWWAHTFTDGADPEYELQIMPLIEAQLDGCELVLDLGCGEGQVARRLGSGGAGGRRTVVGVDPSQGQLSWALRRRPGPLYTRGLGERLPYRAGVFDAVVCCLVIEHVADADTLFAETARVLRPSGRFLLLINHPMYQGAGSGFVDDVILGERYWRVGPYLHRRVFLEQVDPGVSVPFAHRPLSGYLNPLADLGLVLTRMDEPEPLAEFLAASLDAEVEGLIPRLLLMRFERQAPA
jgi:SAM-dependent methyltransferase